MEAFIYVPTFVPMSSNSALLVWNLFMKFKYLLQNQFLECSVPQHSQRTGKTTGQICSYSFGN